MLHCGVIGLSVLIGVGLVEIHEAEQDDGHEGEARECIAVHFSLLWCLFGFVGFFGAVFYGSSHEVAEEGAGREHGAGIFGVVLRAHEPAERRHFHHFHQVGGGIHAHACHACGFELVAVVVVEFKAVAVALADVGATVGACHEAAGTQIAVVGPQA